MNHGPLPAHSPLGASSAYRWLACPGSVAMSDGVADPESEFADLGTAAHWVLERSLKADVEPWHFIGDKHKNGVEVDSEMIVAVSVFTNYTDKTFPDRELGKNFWVEHRFHCPTIHELFYGTADFVYLDRKNRTLDIVDYKHGVGVVVDVVGNPQLRYYAAGVLESLDLWPDVDEVRITIIQPRGFHPDGAIRHDDVLTEELEDWLDDVLVPGMERAKRSTKTKAGEHCRFCPARFRKCPSLWAALEEFEEMSERIKRAVSKGAAPKLTDEELARYLDLNDLTKIAVAAAKKTAFGRMNAGRAIPGRKLVQGTKHRIFPKDEVKVRVKVGDRVVTRYKKIEDLARAKFGDDAFVAPSLKSPAEIEKLPGGKQFTGRHAFKPKGDLTIASASDPKAGISAASKPTFKPVKKDVKHGQN